MLNRKLMGFLIILALSLSGAPIRNGFGWGDEGHRYVNLVAAGKLPADMPAFFKNAAKQISFLGPEPDRWRDSNELYSALRVANNSDHYLDIDNPESFKALPSDRYTYAEWIRARGLNADGIGFLPYSALEAFQKVSVSFRYWRQTRDPEEKAQIEQNIIYYAGVLGHYIADGAQPLHATIHYNGWSTSWNPDEFTREPLHARFEAEFVKACIKAEDIRPLVKSAQRLKDPFSAIMNELFDSHQHVETIYRMEKISPWDANNRSVDSKQFVLQRLAVAAQLLANLWYTAWLN
jgi:hypothetical protein